MIFLQHCREDDGFVLVGQTAVERTTVRGDAYQHAGGPGSLPPPGYTDTPPAYWSLHQV